MTYIDEIIEELENGFINQNCKVFYSDEEKQQILSYYKKCINAIFNADDDTILKKFDDLANLQLLQYTPYIIIFNEIKFIQSKVLDYTFEKKDVSATYKIYELFKKIENNTAKIFLDVYLKELKKKNGIRINSINIFKERNIIKYYAQHIHWLNDLALSLERSDTTLFPQIDPVLCEFGQWLQDGAKLTISNNSQYKNLVTTHTKLHKLSTRIKSLISSQKTIEYMAILTMLKKCEALSIDIGIELSFIKSSEYMQQAHYDPLTQVLNRNYLDDIYESAFRLSKITNKPFCIAMCDLDDFKNINDMYGHDMGDIVLKTFADYLKITLRESDYIIRYGGEEFLMILPSLSLENGKTLIQRCIKNLQNLNIEMESNTVNITASFGIIEINPNDGDRYEFDIESSIHKVDRKLYEAKGEGKNRVNS
jgi:diguanylate cyclase